MEDTKQNIFEQTMLSVLRGVGQSVGAVAVLAAVIYFVPGVWDTIERIATTCFG